MLKDQANFFLGFSNCQQILWKDRGCVILPVSTLWLISPLLLNKDNQTRTTNIQRHFSKWWWVIFKYLLASLLRQISSKSSWTPGAPIGNYIWIKWFVLYGIMGNLLLKQTSSWYDKCSHDHNGACLSDCLKYPELLCITFLKSNLNSSHLISVNSFYLSSRFPFILRHSVSEAIHIKPALFMTAYSNWLDKRPPVQFQSPEYH